MSYLKIDLIISGQCNQRHVHKDSGLTQLAEARVRRKSVVYVPDYWQHHIPGLGMANIPGIINFPSVPHT